MSRFFALFLMAALTILFSGCMKTEYSYTAPPTEAERQCTYHCGAGKASCERICRLKNESCVARTHDKAVSEFNAYKRAQQRAGKRVTKTLYDFESSQFCFKSCDCIKPYNTCYSACGGKVAEKF